MARRPSEIRFVCESCRRPAKVGDIRRWSEQCRYCQGRSWQLLVNYTDTQVEASILGLLSSLIFGVGEPTRKTYTNQVVVDSVSAEVAQFLTEKRRLVASRVVEYIRLREQQELLDRGARACRICNGVCVPAEDKPWTQEGYCSRSCAARDGFEESPLFEPSTDNRHAAPTITVVCPNGHAFEVLASFSGCMRPCPDCGAKTPVP